jgi:hypothetical protein
LVVSTSVVAVGILFSASLLFPFCIGGAAEVEVEGGSSTYMSSSSSSSRGWADGGSWVGLLLEVSSSAEDAATAISRAGEEDVTAWMLL